MANKYYLYLTERKKIIGKYSFKAAMEEKRWYDSVGEESEILKIVVDADGKEVK